MLLYHIRSLCYGSLLFMFLAMACAAYAYHVDARRPADDPKKRDYPPVAIILVPIMLPVFAVLYVSLFILRAVLYGIFLILFVITLIVFRESFLLRWLHKIATYIGNKLLDANTILIRLFVKPWAEGPRTF